jgi:hypothetical protein
MGREEAKSSFFEKKKQKTFARSGFGLIGEAQGVEIALSPAFRGRGLGEGAVPSER